MPIVTLELPQPLWDRLQQIAAEKSVAVDAVVRHFLACGIEVYDSPPGPDPDSFTPSRPRPKIDREEIAAQLAELERLASLGRATDQKRTQCD